MKTTFTDSKQTIDRSLPLSETRQSCAFTTPPALKQSIYNFRTQQTEEPPENENVHHHAPAVQRASQERGKDSQQPTLSTVFRFACEELEHACRGICG